VRRLRRGSNPARTSEDFEVVTADLAAYERLLFDTLLKLPNVSDVRSNFAFGRSRGRPAPALTSFANV
jgi:hypothetical protein